MNKLLIFPLAFMLLLTIFSMVYAGAVYSPDSTPDYSTIDGIEINGSPTSVEIPEAGSYTFDIWDTTGFLLILTAAIAIGILAGINFLGSGLSETSQKMLFDSVLFGGVWGCLSIVSSDFMFSIAYTALLWLCLTLIYIIGVGMHMTQSEG